MVITASEIKEYARGDRGIRHEDLNAYKQAAQRSETLTQGLRSDIGIAVAQDAFLDLEPIVVIPGEDYPRYSVFGVRSGHGFASDPLAMDSAKIEGSTGASLLTYYTNWQDPIKSGEKGWAYPIVPGRRFFISVIGDIPKIGYPCGVENNTLSVTGANTGFVCYSDTEIKQTIQGVWVTLVQDHNLIGKVEEDLTPFDPLTDTLGKGVVRVQARLGSANNLVEASAPVGTFFDLDPVYNILPSLISKNELVLVHPYSATGMLGIPLTGTQTFIGWLTSSLAAGTPQTNPGGTAGTSGGATNIELQKLNTSTLIYEDILDDLGVVVKIKAFNSCAVPVDALQRVQGKYISGVPHVDVVCCPVAP